MEVNKFGLRDVRLRKKKWKSKQDFPTSFSWLRSLGRG